MGALSERLNNDKYSHRLVWMVQVLRLVRSLFVKKGGGGGDNWSHCCAVLMAQLCMRDALRWYMVGLSGGGGRHVVVSDPIGSVG